MKNAKALYVSNPEYDALPELRRSAAWDFFEDGPEVYAGKYVDGLIPREETPAMRLGTYSHYSVLEPELWTKLAAPVDLATRGSKAWGAHSAKCYEEGRIALLAKELTQVNAITEAFRGCKLAQRWLETADTIESTATATDDSGIAVKIRKDITRGHVVIDLKTSSDPTPDGFRHSVEKYGYWYQAAFYLMVEAALRGCSVDELSFATIVVEKTVPHRVAIYELGPEWIEPGIAAVRHTLDELAREQEKQQWMSEWNGTPTMLMPSPYFEKKVFDRIGGAGC